MTDKMDRLTDKALPPNVFTQCQLCGYTGKYSDICEFKMYFECDDDDKIIDRNKVLIACKQEACQKVIGDHPRLYQEAPWGAAAPGAFMLLCSDCPSRANFQCLHPNLKKNGGAGLEVKMAANQPIVRVCFSNGTSRERGFPTPMIECEGNTRK